MGDNMGRQKVVDKAIRPLEVTVNLTPADLTAGRSAGDLGQVPIGVYKGSAALFDLNKLANEPLVWDEQQHILGILDGREEGHDLVTVTVPLGLGAGQSVRGRLTVPPTEVWYINEVLTTLNADPTGTITGVWRCKLWTDRAATPDADGQAFNGVAYPVGVYPDEFYFGAPGPWGLNTDKDRLLRLPGGSWITLQVINTVLGATGSAHTLQLFGFIGKKLVD